MGLELLDETTPLTTGQIKLGASEIRDIKAKLKEFAIIEHEYDGFHSFSSGTLAQRPPAPDSVTFYILIEVGKAPEIQYSKSGAWNTLSYNQDFLDNNDEITNHKTASTLDHPADSVHSTHIVEGAVLSKHLDATNGTNETLEKLVDGSDAGTFHNHDSALPEAVLLTSGSIVHNYTTPLTDVVINETDEIDLSQDASTVKKYMVIARPYFEIAGQIDVDDRAQITCESEGKVITKINFDSDTASPPYTPDENNICYEDYGDIYARIATTGTYSIVQTGGTFPAMITLTIYYEVYELFG